MNSEPLPSPSVVPSQSELLYDLPPAVLPPVPPPSFTSDSHTGLELVEEARPYSHHYAQQEVPEAETLPPPAPRNHPRPHAEPQLSHHPYPEWLSLIMSFCFAGISIAFQTIRVSNYLPLSFHMAGLGVVFALAAFVVSKYIPPYLRREARFLENTGVFFGVTAFFLDIAISFPLCLKIISWIIYAAALLAIFLSRYFNLCFLTRPIEQN